MKCSTCGQALSLRMTRCSVCGTPASFATSSPSNTQHEHHTYAGPMQQQQNSGLHTPSQITYAAYAPIQQKQEVMGMPPIHPLSPSSAYVPDPALQTTLKKRTRRTFLFPAIVLCILVLFAVGSYKLIRIANATNATTHADTPSGIPIIPTASHILKNVQTSRSIDNTLAPTGVTKTFMANQKVYVTFTIASGTQDGFIGAKWYADGQVVATTILQHNHANTQGVFSNVYITPTPDGALELYWCTQADCKDAQLAQVIHFTVTPIDAVPYKRMKSGI